MAEGDTSKGVDAAATIMATYRLGRFFSGSLLTSIVFVREIFRVALYALLQDDPDEVMIAPSFLFLTDRPTGRRIATLQLGRGAYAADEVRQAVERDLHSMSRSEFLAEWAHDWDEAPGR